jgi:hypothetical protein
MYPTTFTELSGLIGILVPLVIATIAGLTAARTKALENELVRWRRINELALTLHNKDGGFGLWAQIAAAHELGEVAPPHRGAAMAILVNAHSFFASNPTLIDSLDTALQRIQRKR